MHDEPVPLRRLLMLRQLPSLAKVELAELAVVADNAIEAVFPAGTVIASPRANVPALHLVIEGRLEQRRGEHVESWEARSVFGLLEILAGRAPVAPVIAATRTHTLRLEASDTMDVLEDNFGLLRELLQGLATQLSRSGGWSRPRIGPVVSTVEELSLVERLGVLRQHVPFVGGPLQALSAVAHAAEELSVPAGRTVTSTERLADAVGVVLAGTLHEVGADGATRTLRVGDAFGALETLAGIPYRSTITSTSPARVISYPGTAILDVLEDHADLGLLMIESLARALLVIERRPTS